MGFPYTGNEGSLNWKRGFPMVIRHTEDIKLVKKAGPADTPVSVVEEVETVPYRSLFKLDSADVIQAAEDFRTRLDDWLREERARAAQHPDCWVDINDEGRFLMWLDTWGVPLDLLYQLVVKPEEGRVSLEEFAAECGSGGPSFAWVTEDEPEDDGDDDAYYTAISNFIERLTDIFVFAEGGSYFSRWNLEELVNPTRWNRIVDEWVKEQRRNPAGYYRQVRQDFDDFELVVGKFFPTIRIPRRLFRLLMTLEAEELGPGYKPECWSCGEMMFRLLEENAFRPPLEPGLYACVATECCGDSTTGGVNIVWDGPDIKFQWFSRFRDVEHLTDKGRLERVWDAFMDPATAVEA